MKRQAVEDYSNQAVATLLVSLRIAPAFAFSPPFTLLRVPALVRVMLSVSLAAWLVSGHPQQTWQADFWAPGLFVTALGELLLGVSLSLALQLAFAALLTVGRAIDIQAGFGLSMLLDPTTRAQVPLAGTLFAYAAAAIFFATDGPADMLAIWAASITQVPLGSAGFGGDLGALTTYMSAIFVLAFGAGGLLMLVLFVLDIAISLMSRTMPQMNVLLLGFQVKTLAMLIVLAARFMLDSMPGQQMSIDADLNMGLIDQKQAVQRREELEKEASFYGSMDGASKFVKGDAITGILILLINIIGGWIIGVMQMDMAWDAALERFTLLTIGDGIATQLPALIIAIATGIIVTRSSADRELSTEVFRQLASVPRIPLIVAAVLLALLLLPGMPKWPIAVIIALALLAWHKARKAAREAEAAADELAGGGPAPALEIRLGSELSLAWKAEEAIVTDRIAGLRRVFEGDYGLGFPAVRMGDGAGLGTLEYEIRLFGSRFALAEIYPDRVLAIRSGDEAVKLDGIQTQDPAFGLPALWILPDAAADARAAGLKVIDPVTVLITHFGEIVQSEMATLVTRSVVVKIMEDVRERQPGLLKELIPNSLTISDVQRVLQNLLGEGVSIANVDLILEHLTDLARTQKETGELTELVRQRISHSICHQLRGKHNDLAVLSLDPRIENQITTNAGQAGPRGTLLVEPKLAEQLIRKLSAMSEDMHREGRSPVLLCGAAGRRQLKAFTKRSIPRLSVLSVNEIPMRINLKSFDVVKLEA